MIKKKMLAISLASCIGVFNSPSVFAEAEFDLNQELGLTSESSSSSNSSKLGDAFAEAEKSTQEAQTLEQALGGSGNDLDLITAPAPSAEEIAANDILSKGDKNILGQEPPKEVLEDKKEDLQLNVVASDNTTQDPTLAPLNPIEDTTTPIVDDTAPLNLEASNTPANELVLNAAAEAKPEPKKAQTLEEALGDDIISLDAPKGKAAASADTAPLSLDAVSDTAPLSLDAASDTAPLSLEAASDTAPLSLEAASDTAPLSLEAASDTAPLSLDAAASTTTGKPALGDAFAEAEKSTQEAQTLEDALGGVDLSSTDATTTTPPVVDDTAPLDIAAAPAPAAENNEKSEHELLLEALEKQENSKENKEQTLQDALQADDTAPLPIETNANANAVADTALPSIEASAPAPALSAVDGAPQITPITADEQKLQNDAVKLEQTINALENTAPIAVDAASDTAPILEETKPEEDKSKQGINAVDVFANASANKHEQIDLTGVGEEHAVAQAAPEQVTKTKNEDDVNVIGTYIIQEQGLDGQMIISATGNTSQFGNSILGVSLFTTTAEGYGCRIQGTAEMSDSSTLIIKNNANAEDIIVGDIKENGSIVINGESKTSCSAGAYIKGTYNRK